MSFFLLSSVTANEELIATIVEEAPLDVHALPQLTKTNKVKNKILRGISIANSNRSNKNENVINKVRTYDHSNEIDRQNVDLDNQISPDSNSGVGSNSIRVPEVGNSCPVRARFDLYLERNADTFASDKLIEVVITPELSTPRNLYTIGGENRNEISIMRINPSDPLDLYVVSNAEDTKDELMRTTSLENVHDYLENLSTMGVTLDGEYVITAGTNEGPVSKKGGITIMKRDAVGKEGRLRVVQQYRLDEARGLRDIPKGMIGINSIAASNHRGYQQFFVTSGGYGNDFNLMAFVMTDSLPDIVDSYRTQGVSEYIPIFTLTDNIEIYHATESRLLPVQVLAYGGYVYVLGNNPAISTASILVYHQSDMGKLRLVQEMGPLSGTAFVSGIIYSSSDEISKSYLYVSTSYSADNSNLLQGFNIDIHNGQITPIPADQLYPPNSPIPTRAEGSYSAKIPMTIQKVQLDDKTYDRLVVVGEKDNTLDMAIINKENGSLCAYNTIDISSYTKRPTAIIAPGEDILPDKVLYLGSYLDGNIVTVKVSNTE